TDAASAGDVIVGEVDIALAVERHRDLRAGELDAKRVPLARRDGRIDVLQRLAAAARGVIQRYVVLECIGTSDVVVVAILPAPHHAAGLILLARERLEFRLDPAIRQARLRLDAPREGRRARLTQHLASWRAGIAFDAPLRSATACHAASTSRGRRTDSVGAGVDRVSHGARR